MKRAVPHLLAGFAAFAAGMLASTCHSAPAAWPLEKPITLIVGFPPGGTVDTQVRVVAALLSHKTGKPVVVENKIGAFGAAALHAAESAPADGYTILTIAGPSLDMKDFPGPKNGLKPVAMLARSPMVLVASMANAPPADLQSLLSEVRRNPSAWSYASSGVGTPQHLAGELLNRLAGTSIMHVPYRGGSQAVGDIIGGQVPLGMLGVTPLLPYIRSGQLKAYAVTSASRLRSTLPNVPTMTEAGLKGYDISQWYALAVPWNVPQARVEQLNRWINEIMNSEEMKAPLQNMGSLPMQGSPAFASSFIRAENEKWRSLALIAGIAN